MAYSDVIRKVSKDTNLPQEFVDAVYKSFWRFIRDTASQMPLKEISEEDFYKLRPNFNIPSLGKLCCTKDRYINMRKRFNYIKNIREKND